MKIILVGVNSKYIHTNLAVRKIRAYLADRNIPVEIKEYSGSEEIHRAAAHILADTPDVIGFSCYIWNIDYVLKLAETVKKASPDTKIVLGGPEAEFSAEKLLAYHFIDAIAKGEGERIYEEIFGGSLLEIMTAPPLEMDEMPFPYTEAELKDKNRIFYYESSRGCPFGCTYCLSSAEKGIRLRTAEKTLSELKIFADNKVKLVKLIDRTFNSNLKRSCEILEGLAAMNCETEFHIEIAADTVNDEFINILKKFPAGRLRIEAGLQSINPDTLTAVNRHQNLERLAKNIKNIVENTNVTLHLDLIAGLPFEDFESFKNSFNFAYNLRPHELQLGFLKVLPGTKIAAEAEKYNIMSTGFPPYEIISNKFISFAELSTLKDMEAVLDMYGNGGILKNSEEILINAYETPFDFYYALAKYFREKGLLSAPHHRVHLFDFIYDFARNRAVETPLLKDYFLACRGASVPSWATPAEDIEIRKDKLNEIITDDEKIAALPELQSIDKRMRHKFIRTEKVLNMIWLISYEDGKIQDITKYFV